MEDSSKQPDVIPHLTKYIPLFSVFSFLYGISDLTFYYTSFNINILSYLEVSEIISLTLYGFCVISFIGFVLYIMCTYVIMPSLNALIKYVSASSIFNRHFKGSTIILLSVIFLIDLILFAIATFFLKQKSEPAQFTLFLQLLLLMFSIGLITAIFVIKYYNKYKEDPKKEVIAIFVFFCLCTGAPAWVSSTDAERLKTSKDRLTSFIYLEHRLIKPTKTYYYIGKTNKYAFYFNEYTGACDVFPMNLVTKMTLKNWELRKKTKVPSSK
jgi:hypothetical protein